MAALLTVVHAEPAHTDGTLRLALQRTPTALDPYTYLSLPEWYLQMNLTATLVEFDSHNQLRPGLLTRSYSISPDGRVARFRLRLDRQWSDGTPITPEQILSSIFEKARHKSSEYLTRLLDSRPLEQSVYLYNGDELVVRLAANSRHFLYMLTRAEFGVVRWDRLSRAHTLTAQTPTSGDYAIQSISDTQIVLTPNRHSTRSTADSPHRVIADFIPDAKAVSERVRTGTLDFIEAQSDDLLRQARAAGVYTILPGGLDNLATLQSRQLNQTQRHAFSVLARYLNRQQLLREGRETAATLVPTTTRGSQRLGRAEAKRLLTNSPISLTLELGSDASTDQVADAQQIRAQAGEIGINLEVKHWPEALRPRWEREEYSMTLVRMGMWGYDEVELLNGYFCANFRPYRSLEPLVCQDIKAASESTLTPEQVDSRLDEISGRLAAQGAILPLYRFARQFVIHRRWDVSEHNTKNPYPMFYRLRSHR